MPMDDELWAEIAEGVPSRDDPFIQQYLAGRDSLDDKEKASRSDASFRKSMSRIANKACAIVDRIRRHELKTVWTAQLEEDMAKQDERAIFPGMMYMLAKERMESTMLWKVVRRMPKGCLLHAHLDAMVDFDFIIARLLDTPGIHISSSAPLTKESAMANAALSFRYRKQPRADGSLWNNDYVPGTYILLTQAADAFPGGGREAFCRWLKSRCTLSLVDSHEQHHGIVAIWKKFESCFAVCATMIHYEPIFRSFLRRLMQQLKADGVNWAELRFTWQLDYCRDGQEEPEKDYSHVFQVLDEEIACFKDSPEGKGFWGLRIIWSNLRVSTSRSIIEDMDACITTKLEYPHLISGYDLVGPEDAGHPLDRFIPELFWFSKECAEAKVIVPFFFHAGETLGDGTSTDANLFDAVLLGTRRIGHAYSLYKHPMLIEMVKEKRILVESCPISNEMLRLCSSIMSHPLPALLARGVACSLNNDDPAMLGQDTTNLSPDFWQALQGWDNLGLAGLGSLAENSVRWAAFVDEDAATWVKGVKEGRVGDGLKAKRIGEWQAEWEHFCLWIVQEFGEQFGQPSDEELPENPILANELNPDIGELLAGEQARDDDDDDDGEDEARSHDSVAAASS